MPAWLTWQAVRLFLGDKVKAALPILARRWREVLIVILLLVIWHKDALLAACHTFRADVKTTGKQATANQIAVNHRPAVISQAIAEKSDAQAPAYYSAVRAAAAAHRVRPAPDRGSPSHTNLPGADPALARRPEPAAVSDLVCRSRADDAQLTDGAAYGYKVSLELQALKSAGLVKEADPPSASSDSSSIKDQ